MAPNRPTRRLGADPLSAHAAASRRVRRIDRQTSAFTETPDPGALALLSQVLLGEGDWSLAEVRRLVILRDRVAFDPS